jgi:hypothetical protein
VLVGFDREWNVNWWKREGRSVATCTDHQILVSEARSKIRGQVTNCGTTRSVRTDDHLAILDFDLLISNGSFALFVSLSVFRFVFRTCTETFVPFHLHFQYLFSGDDAPSKQLITILTSFNSRAMMAVNRVRQKGSISKRILNTWRSW